MRIRWDNLMANKKKQFENMSEAEKYVYFLLIQHGSPYGWGKETPESSDCSGAVCMALFAATGLLIRTTADDLYKRVFTRTSPRQGEIRAVFCLAKTARKHGDRTVAAGTATHIAGIVDEGVVLNSQEPFTKVRGINELADIYRRNGHEVAIRGLDREALARLAVEGKTVHGLDAEFTRYFDL